MMTDLLASLARAGRFIHRLPFRRSNGRRAVQSWRNENKLRRAHVLAEAAGDAERAKILAPRLAHIAYKGPADQKHAHISRQRARHQLRQVAMRTVNESEQEYVRAAIDAGGRIPALMRRKERRKLARAHAAVAWRSGWRPGK